MGHQRQATLPTGQKVGIEHFLINGRPPPPELVDDLPHIQFYGEPVPSAVGVPGRGCFAFDHLAYEVVASFAPPHWRHPVGKVTYSGIPARDRKWFFVSFQALQQPELIIDLEHSQNLEWRELTGPNGTIRRLKPVGVKRMLPSLFQDKISGLTLWQGVGAEQLTTICFCCDAFKAAWDERGLTGLMFDHVPETTRNK